MPSLEFIQCGYPARLGHQFVIENRVGAGSIIGTTSLAKAAPDGYAIGVGTSAGLAIGPLRITGTGARPPSRAQALRLLLEINRRP